MDGIKAAARGEQRKKNNLLNARSLVWRRSAVPCHDGSHSALMHMRKMQAMWADYSRRMNF